MSDKRDEEAKRRYMRAYNKRPGESEKRAVRMAARRQLEKEGLVKKHDGKDVHHKTPLHKGGGNGRSNLAVAKPSEHRGHTMASRGRRPKKS